MKKYRPIYCIFMEIQLHSSTPPQKKKVTTFVQSSIYFTLSIVLATNSHHAFFGSFDEVNILTKPTECSHQVLHLFSLRPFILHTTPHTPFNISKQMSRPVFCRPSHVCVCVEIRLHSCPYMHKWFFDVAFYAEFFIEKHLGNILVIITYTQSV